MKSPCPVQCVVLPEAPGPRASRRRVAHVGNTPARAGFASVHGKVRSSNGRRVAKLHDYVSARAEARSNANVGQGYALAFAVHQLWLSGKFAVRTPHVPSAQSLALPPQRRLTLRSSGLPSAAAYLDR